MNITIYLIYIILISVCNPTHDLIYYLNIYYYIVNILIINRNYTQL